MNKYQRGGKCAEKEIKKKIYMGIPLIVWQNTNLNLGKVKTTWDWVKNQSRELQDKQILELTKG